VRYARGGPGPRRMTRCLGVSISLARSIAAVIGSFACMMGGWNGFASVADAGGYSLLLSMTLGKPFGPPIGSWPGGGGEGTLFGSCFRARRIPARHWPRRRQQPAHGERSCTRSAGVFGFMAATTFHARTSGDLYPGGRDSFPFDSPSYGSGTPPKCRTGPFWTLTCRDLSCKRPIKYETQPIRGFVGLFLTERSDALCAVL